MSKTNSIKGLSYDEMSDKTKDFYDNYCRDGLLIPMEQVIKRKSKIKSWSVEMDCEVMANVNSIMYSTWVNTDSVIDRTKYTIKRFKKTHGDKYDYSKVEYKYARDKVTIICPDHGEFKQTPDKHIRGRGCPKCGGTLRSNTNEFIEKAREIHGDKYDYSKVDYVNSETEVTIICPDHGEFKQIPRAHLIGKGCLKCGGTSRLNTNEFIEKARKIHGDKYDYSKVEYINSETEVIIICPKHGEFKQIPRIHLYQGAGCLVCNNSKGEDIIYNYLNENNIIFSSQKRFIDCRNKNPLPFDFYLEKYNLCIEYDGIQHFVPRSRFGGKRGFKTTQKHDKIKNDYCENNNINLLRISYEDKDRIHEILDEYFRD